MEEQRESDRRIELFNTYLHSEAYQETLLKRLQINDACMSKAEARQITWQLCARPDSPAEGCIFFIENFGWTFDPRKNPPHLPFILFDYQKEAIRWLVDHIDNGRDGLIEKSRDMGVTWLSAWVFMWFWLFRDGTSLLMGSYKERLVDDRTDDSLFGRLDYAIDSLPKWILPTGYNGKKHRTHLKLINPANYNLIAGESMNGDFGRGMRKLAIFFDELGSWDYAKDAWESCLSGDHEVLTDSGWVNIKDVTIEDRVLSMDKDSGITKYMPVQKKTKNFYKEMIHFKGKSIDSIVSPDHQMLYETKSGKRFLKDADYVKDLKSGSLLLGNKGFISDKDLPDFHGYKGEDFMEFLGWYISEGCHSTGGGIKISQSSMVNPDKYHRIQNLLERLDMKFTASFDHFYIWKGSIPDALHNELRKLGKCDTKHIPDKYLDLPKQFLLPLWQGLVLGDGYNLQREGRVNVTGYVTSSEVLANQVQGLLQLLGFNASVKKKKENGRLGMYNVRLKYKTKVNLARLGTKVIDWNDYAYCLTTPLHTIFVRRKGLAYWVGNCGDVTQCRIANSTPKGYNFYAKLRNDGIDVLTLHWKEHPLKDQIWYDFEKTRRSEEEVAQELDISYNKSQEGRVYSEWNEVNVQTGDYEYDHGAPLYVGWDFGRDDNTAIVWIQPYNNSWKIIDAYTRTGKLIDFYVPFITGVVSSDNYNYTPPELEMIERHKYWSRGTHFGDPAGRFHNQVTNDTVLSVLKNHGIMVNFQDAWKEFAKRKTAVKSIIQDGLFIHKSPTTDYFNMCMAQASYPKVTSEGEKEIRSIKPKHDWTSHYRSAFEYLALGLSEFQNVRSKPYDKFKPRERGRSIGY